MAWKVAVAFAAAAVLWLLIVDALLYAFTRERAVFSRLEAAKDWTFVLLTSGLLYFVALRAAAKVARAQATTEAIVQSIADGILVLGHDRTIAYANPAAVNMLGCKTAEELVGMTAVEFARRFRTSYPDGTLVAPEHYISQRVFEEGGPLHYTASVHPPDNPEVILSVMAAAVRNGANELPQLVVSVMHDITAKERLERLRDHFLSSAAHSLKTPIAILKANAQLLSQGAPPDVPRSAAAIERQCGRIDRLVQNMLLLARIRSKTLALNPQELELAPLVESVTREMAKDTRRHELRAELHAAPRVHGDFERLAIALRNMIEEGFRNSKLGTSLTVLLETRGRDAEIGFRYQPLPADERAERSADAQTELDIAGTVAQSIIESHGGALSRESAGSMTTAWIRLPVVESPHGQA